MYSLDIETGQSNKLLDMGADMFASYGDSIFIYSLESEKLCEYSINGELISENVIKLKNDDLSVDALIVTKDFLGPGTAPLTKRRLFSTSTFTISRFCTVIFFPPICPGILFPLNTLLGSEQAPLEPA